MTALEEHTMTPEECIAKHKLTVDAVFVPWSHSRNFKPDANVFDRSLNWRVTLKHDGRDVLTTDYSAGIAHCPAYKLPTKAVGRGMTLMRSGYVEHEVENGTVARRAGLGIVSGNPIVPDATDVIWSIILGADAIDYPTFEDWAECFGYDTDSRKAEKVYRTCLEFGLKLRYALGDDALSELREAFQDY